MSFIIFFLAAGCSKKADIDRVPDLETAHQLMERKRYEEARQEYRGVMNIAEDSNTVAQIILYIARSYEAQGEWLDASLEYEQFLSRFPEHAKADGVMIRLMEMYMEQIRTIDRDVKPARQTYTIAQRFYRNYPDSQRTGEVESMEADALATIVAHEAYILDYYLRTKRYGNAEVRLNRLQRDYPELYESDKIQKQNIRLQELQSSL
ncbi:outer membrane protein assembly factor BamD [Desulfurispira natronophila]|uniref:Outer membrane protein assembly factor BamD n=1 Tax=Desulfurispira natronophila TaxID=682562 RepID=A0A7W8DFW1_9BACT|nr:outer membrane protein assembly factor BamD [Desulfurispira natronophila]MBB5020851.1 outer membrane protein assembly factor BamD [Desulfurispira natronophila]